MSKALENCLNELDNELYRAVAKQADEQQYGWEWYESER